MEPNGQPDWGLLMDRETAGFGFMMSVAFLLGVATVVVFMRASDLLAEQATIRTIERAEEACDAPDPVLPDQQG